MTNPPNDTLKALHADNPLLKEWKGNFGGVPPFDNVRVADFKLALDTAMAENLMEISKIASDSRVPNFENTFLALERAGKTLSRVQTIYDIWGSSMNTPEFQQIETEMAPILAGFYDKIIQNEKLFNRIEAVYRSPDKAKLSAEQQRLIWVYYTNFVAAGAKLSEASKKRMSEINQELAGLYTKFGQNQLADESDQYLVLANDSDLAGLPQSLKDAAAEEALSRKIQAIGVISNTRSSIDPFLTYSDPRDLREKAWKLFVSRGDNGDAHDNNEIIVNILKLRSERAKLLGYMSHAYLKLANTMAQTPENAISLMETVWKPAVLRVQEEVKDMQALALKEGKDIKIEPWDYRYYAEKVRKEKYDIDQNEVKEYLQLDKLREGMFWVAGKLFDFSFEPVKNIPVFHPDVQVWEVKNKKTGKHIGLWYFDAYAREGKRSGAWMNAYRNQQRVDGEISTIVSNNSNFVKGKPGEPVLISWDDATTLFHEFGHALHGLSSNVNYPSLSGTNVVRDYVEFPSQLLEHWLETPEVLQKFALHYKTGKPIPPVLVERLEKSSTFNQGFSTIEYLSSALIDMKIHMAKPEKVDPDKFERETLEDLGMPGELVMRHRLPHFGHVFSGDGYSAGYYSYLWSDVLTSDAFDAFVEAKGPYDKTVAARLQKYVFSVGNSIDPAEGYKSFRGREAKTEALMKQRGFPVTEKDENKK